MDQPKPKRRGCPPGGWPSVNARKAAAVKAKVNEQKFEVTRAPEAPLTYAFSLVLDADSEGRNLWRVEMLTLRGNSVVKRAFLSPGDLKGNALAKLRYSAFQLWFNERIPEETPDLLPSQPAYHG